MWALRAGAEKYGWQAKRLFDVTLELSGNKKP